MYQGDAIFDLYERLFVTDAFFWLVFALCDGMQALTFKLFEVSKCSISRCSVSS
jgi:hypothetical protein